MRRKIVLSACVLIGLFSLVGGQAFANHLPGEQEACDAAGHEDAVSHTFGCDCQYTGGSASGTTENSEPDPDRIVDRVSDRVDISSRAPSC